MHSFLSSFPIRTAPIDSILSQILREYHDSKEEALLRHVLCPITLPDTDELARF